MQFCISCKGTQSIYRFTALAQLRIFENLIQNLLARRARENLSKICCPAENLLANSQCSDCQALKNRHDLTGPTIQPTKNSLKALHFIENAGLCSFPTRLSRFSDNRTLHGTILGKFCEICYHCVCYKRENLSKICCSGSKYAHQNLREKKQNP